MSEKKEANELSLPKKGDRLHCHNCSMELQVTKDCGCKDAKQVHFQCCNKDMHKEVPGEKR